MKWYKKQMDALLKEAKPTDAKVDKTDRPASKERFFNADKKVMKKFPKPGEKRSRQKTDSF